MTNIKRQIRRGMKQKTNLFFLKPKFFWLNIHLLKKKKHRWKERFEEITLKKERFEKSLQLRKHQIVNMNIVKKNDNLKNIIHRADRADLVHLKYLNSI